MERIKIAIILPYFGPGGAEKMAAHLGCGLNTEQFDVEVFCIYGHALGNKMERDLREKAIPIHYIGKKKGFSVSAVLKLFQELDRFSPDLIHTHQYACVYAALWPVIRKKPFLHTFHTLPEVENKRPVRRMLTKWLVRKRRMVPVTISEGNQRMVAEYYQLPTDEVPMVYNPVDVKRFASAVGKNDGCFRFITVGRFSKVKNQELMYRAFGLFLKHGYDARLLMLGKGEEEANLKALAEELGVSDRIEYTGYVDNVEDYLKTADVFLLSSHYEAQPLCVLEAMASGLPVISTDVGAVADIVKDNGILVPPGDVEAMAKAMEKLYLDEVLRLKMSERASGYAAEYDVSNTVSGYSELYRRYANKK